MARKKRAADFSENSFYKEVEKVVSIKFKNEAQKEAYDIIIKECNN